MSDKLKFSIPGRPQYLQMVRLAVGSLATQSKYDVEKVEDIQLAVEEACKLVACHGQDGFSEFYEIEVEMHEEQMEIVVSDFCTCNKIDKNCLHFCSRCPEEGNLGPFVIESLMDKFETEAHDGNRRIKMVKNR